MDLLHALYIEHVCFFATPKLGSPKGSPDYGLRIYIQG